MIRTVLFLRPKNNDAKAVARFYVEGLVLERALSKPGCVSAEISLPREATDPILVTAVWESPEAYQGWVEDPWRQHAAAELSSLLDEELAGTASGFIYEVAHAVPSLSAT